VKESDQKKKSKASDIKKKVTTIGLISFIDFLEMPDVYAQQDGGGTVTSDCVDTPPGDNPPCTT
jgi:hypothetical protein